MLLKYLINMDRKTKIIATVGPSLSSESKIEKIIDAGANVLRRALTILIFNIIKPSDHAGFSFGFVPKLFSYRLS